MHRITKLNGGDINVINGPDEMLICGLTMGADGGIGSTYNVIPAWYCALYEAFRRGDFAAARDWHDVVEGEVLRPDLASTVVADALRDLGAPPVRLTQLARLRALAPHVRGIGIEIKPVVHIAGIRCRMVAKEGFEPSTQGL